MTGSGVLFWAEVARGGVSANSLELLALGRRLADARGGEVSALLSGAGRSAHQVAETLIRRGADRVFTTGGDDGNGQCIIADEMLTALSAAAGRVAPAVILLPHSDCGTELAPRLACRLDSAAAMGCVDAEVDGTDAVFIRPCYGGKAHARVRVRASPAIATIQPKAFRVPDADTGRSGKVVALEPDEPAGTPRVRIVVQRLSEEEQGPRLDDAEIVVTGGRGMGGPEGFRMLEALAEMLGGAVGASRPACDLGWYPRSHQVGLSGRTVAPELYLAVGVSGAQHHMAGCGNSKVLVAVNNDPGAEIFTQAHIGVVADGTVFVPALVQALHDRAERTRGTPASSV